MNEKHTLGAVCKQVSMACCVGAMNFLLNAGEVMETYYFPMSLLVYAPLLYFLDRLLLRRERSMQYLIILNTVAAVAYFLSVCFLADWEKFIGLLFIGLISGWLSLQAGQLAQKGPELQELILCLDCSVALLVIYAAYAVAEGSWDVRGVPAVAGVAAAILGVISRRLNRPLGLREWCFVAVAFSGMFGVMWVLVTFVAGPAGGGLVALWNGALAVAKWLSGLFFRLLVFLLSLLPTPEGELESMEQDAMNIMSPDNMLREEDPAVMVTVLIIAAVAIITFVLALAWKLRRLRIGGEKKEKTKKPQRQRVSLRKGLLRLWQRWVKALRQRLFLWKHRDTPQGLLYLLLRKCRKTDLRHQAGETPREFLLRLSQCCGQRDDLSASLTRLATAVDARLYGPAPHWQPLPEGGKIRRGMTAVLRRRRLQTLGETLRARLKKPSTNQ